MFVDRLLTDVEDAGQRVGRYDARRGYTIVDGRPLVAITGPGQTATETRVGREPGDPDAWAETTTMTKISRESDDRD